MVKPGESKKVSTNYGELNVKLSLPNPDNTWFGSRSTQVESHNAPYEQNLGCHKSYIIKEENQGRKVALKLVEARYGTLWQEKRLCIFMEERDEIEENYLNLIIDNAFLIEATATVVYAPK